MLKKIDKLIAIIMLLTLFSILFNKFIGKLVIIFTFVLVLKILIEKRSKALIGVGIVVVLGIYNYLISKQYFYLELEFLNKYSNREYLFRMILFSAMLCIFSDKNMVLGIYKCFKKYLNLVIGLVCIYEIIIVLLAITNIGFINRWGMKVFVGLSGSPHANAYIMILLSIVIEWIINEKKNNKYLLLHLIPIISVFDSGARTPAFVMLGLFLAIRSFNKKEGTARFFRITWKKMMIVSFALSIFVLCSTTFIDAFLSSNIMEKFISTSESGNVLNSRDKIWNGIITDYTYNFSNKEKLLGHGIHYTVVINKNNVMSEIWGHSDFVDILVSYGAIVLAMYIILYLRYFIKMCVWGEGKILVIAFAIAMFMLSIFNGVINYTMFIPIIAFWAIYYISICERNS